jgi:hypothetical protein
VTFITYSTISRNKLLLKALDLHEVYPPLRRLHFVVEIVRKSANFRPAIMSMARKEFDKRAVEKQFGVGDIVYVQRTPT